MYDGTIGSTFFLLLIMIAVLAAAYFVTKFISKKSMRLMKSKYIKVCDRVSVSKDKQIVLIEVGGTYFLVGLSGNSVSLISTFDSETFSELEKQRQEGRGKGIFRGIADFVSNAKNAQTTLYNERKKRKNQTQEDDVLEQIIKSTGEQSERMKDKRDGGRDF